jgi:hypothetical protein
MARNDGDKMNFSIHITIVLDEYDAKVQEYCDENPYDVPDYNTLIDRIQEDLEKLAGVQRVMFNHTSWMTVYLTSDDFDEARDEAEVVKEEIRQVFAKHGVK